MGYTDAATLKNSKLIIKALKSGDSDKWLIQEITHLKMSVIEYCLCQLKKNGDVFTIRLNTKSGAGSRIVWSLVNQNSFFPLVIKASTASKQAGTVPDLPNDTLRFMGYNPLLQKQGSSETISNRRSDA